MRLKYLAFAVCIGLAGFLVACNLAALVPCCGLQAAGPSAPTMAAQTLAASTLQVQVTLPPTATPASTLPPAPTEPPALIAPVSPQPQAVAETSSPVAPTIAALPVFVAQINIQNYGYEPQVLALPGGQPIELHLVTNGVQSCSRAFTIPMLGVDEILPESGDVVVNIPAQAPGTNIDFMCSMGMFTGVFQFK
jgi:hypothetical protein